MCLRKRTMRNARRKKKSIRESVWISGFCPQRPDPWHPLMLSGESQAFPEAHGNSGASPCQTSGKALHKGEAWKPFSKQSLSILPHTRLKPSNALERNWHSLGLQCPKQPKNWFNKKLLSNSVTFARGWK